MANSLHFQDHHDDDLAAHEQTYRDFLHTLWSAVAALGSILILLALFFA